jgi:hypothetical protein
MILIFLICALVGIIPESGPHMIFVMMFAKVTPIPFRCLRVPLKMREKLQEAKKRHAGKYNY